MRYLFLLLVFLSCSEPGISIKDASGNEYESVKIGSQTWLTTNLKTTRLNSGASVEYWVSSNGSKYYSWDVVHGNDICPKGFKVPSKSDWTVLIDHYGGLSQAGNSLPFEFNSVPYGYRSSDGNIYADGFSYWWTSSSSGGGGYAMVNEDGESIVYINAYPVDFAMCVRCLKE